MQFYLIMKSGSVGCSKSWFYKPSYFSQELMDACDKLSGVMDNKANKYFLKNQAFINFYFIGSQCGCALFRVRESDSYDLTGETIYSLEGISCENSQMKNMWYYLPELIDYMSFYDHVYRDDIENDISLNNQFIEKFIDIPIEGYSPKIYHLNNFMQMRQNFIQLAKDIDNAAKIYSFVFGNKNKEFYPYNFSKYYLFLNDKILNDSFEFAYDGYWEITPKSKIADVPCIKIDKRYYKYRCKLYIDFIKKGTKLYAVICAKDNHSNVICECEPLQFEKHNIDFSLIDSAVECVFKVLEQKGYRQMDKSFIFTPFKSEVLQNVR